MHNIVGVAFHKKPAEHSVRMADHPEWILPRGWIDDGQVKPGESINPRARSLNLSEIQKIRRVGNCLQCHHQEERFFQDFKSWRSDLPEDHPPL